MLFDVVQPTRSELPRLIGSINPKIINIAFQSLDRLKVVRPKWFRDLKMSFTTRKLKALITV